MSINTSNPSSLQISGSGNEVNFNVLTNDFINAKITGNATVGGVVYHAWEFAYPVGGSEQTLASDRSLGYGTTTQNPAVTFDNVALPAGTFVAIRKRSTHNTYGAIFEAVTSGAGTSSTATIVPSVGTLMEWRGEFVSGNLKVYDFAGTYYYMLLDTLGTHGWRFYSNSSVLSGPPGWFIYAGSSGSTLVPMTTVTGRAMSVDVVLPCSYSNGFAVWNGYQVANDGMRLLQSRGAGTFATCIRLNASSGNNSSTGWNVMNAATTQYTI